MNPVSIHIDKLYKNDLPLEDCKISVPFAKGILYAKDLSALRLLDPELKDLILSAVLVGSGPTKSFAQSFLPLVQFYNAMISEEPAA